MFYNLSTLQIKLLDYMFLKSIVDETHKIDIKIEDLSTTAFKYSSELELKELFKSLYSLSFWHKNEAKEEIIKIFNAIQFFSTTNTYKIEFNKEIYKFATKDDLYWLFSHKYAAKLYKTLKNQYDISQKKYTASVDLEELRVFLLNNNDKYPASKDFIKNIIDTAVNEINKFTVLHVNYEPVYPDNKKPGRSKCSQIKFTVFEPDSDVLFENTEEIFELSEVPGQISINEYIESVKDQIKKHNEDLFIAKVNKATEQFDSIEKASYISQLLSSLS